MDFLDRLIDFIEMHVDLNTVMKVGKLDENPSAISIRPTPSGEMTRYADKGIIRDYSFQILVKDPIQIKVINLLDEITNLLNGLSNSAIKSENGSFIFIKCDVYVFPNYVETTDHEEYIYTAMFNAEIEGGN